jgi:hypothetical protein
MPIATGNAGVSSLRVSLSARPERIEVCRTLSKAEMEKLEEHMRQRVQCEGRSATYQLSVHVGDSLIHESIVRGGGLRHDRSIYLLRNFNVPSGMQRLRVSFVRREKSDGDSARIDSDDDADEDSGLFRGRAEREREERTRRARAAVPSRLMLDSVVRFSPGSVRVLTFESERRKLALLGNH